MWNTTFLRKMWNKLDRKIKNSESIETLKKRILSFIRPSPNSTFNCGNPRGIKLLSRLRPGLSHLIERNFKHSFQDSLNPFCSCGKCEVDTSSHYLLHCSNFSEERLALLNTTKNIDLSILQQSDSKFTSVLLFGDTSFDNNKNTFILDGPRCHYGLYHFDRKIWWHFIQQFLTSFCKQSVVNEILYSLQQQNFHLGLFVFMYS